jgi:hypothetical protein
MCVHLRNLIEGGYSKQWVFNAETRIYCKWMPLQTYITKEEKKVSSFKASKDRVALLFGNNANEILN